MQTLASEHYGLDGVTKARDLPWLTYLVTGSSSDERTKATLDPTPPPAERTELPDLELNGVIHTGHLIVQS